MNRFGSNGGVAFRSRIGYPAPKPIANATTKAIIKFILDNAGTSSSFLYFFLGCGPIALRIRAVAKDRTGQSVKRDGASALSCLPLSVTIQA